jgi:hypothetical protein
MCTDQADCQVKCCAPPSCPAMAPQGGYVVCGETAANTTCVVQCAPGYTGMPTTYLCDGTLATPAFVAQGAVGQCVPVLYVLWACHERRCNDKRTNTNATRLLGRAGSTRARPTPSRFQGPRPFSVHRRHASLHAVKPPASAPPCRPSSATRFAAVASWATSAQFRAPRASRDRPQHTSASWSVYGRSSSPRDPSTNATLLLRRGRMFGARAARPSWFRGTKAAMMC